jgi:hypothetical protein
MKPINNIPLPSFPLLTFLHIPFPTLYSPFIINSEVNVQRGFLIYPSCEYTLLWSVQFPLLLSLTPFLPPPIIQQLSIHIIMSSTSTDCNTFLYCWLSIFLPSFPSSPRCHTVVPLLHTFLHIGFYIIMLVFMYMFIFCIYLPHMRENMWPLSFWTWLTSLTLCPPIT